MNLSPRHQGDAAPIGAQAEDWEDCYRRDDDGWDLGEPCPPLRRLLADGSGPTGRVLVPGCGSGHDAALLAEHGRVVVAVDFAPTALARTRARLAPWRDRCLVLAADVVDEQAVLPRVDAVFDHTFFCALLPSQRSAYVAALARLLPPGGELWAINLRTSFTDRQPYDCAPETFRELLAPRFELVTEQPLDAWSHPRRRGRERLMHLRRREAP